MDYDHMEGGVYSYVPWEPIDFQSMVYLWGSTPPYSELNASSMIRLLFAFENEKSIIFKNGINTIGLALWGWMYTEEYGSVNYRDDEIYERDTGEILVLTDLIMPNNARLAKNHLLNFAKQMLPNEKSVAYYRSNNKSSLRINL